MSIEHVDVLIVGAGISGIGAACHLETECPGKTYVILEARDAIGGTWDLFRYPGIRSDSDMYTLGYRFKPWTNPKAIADGPAILSYLHETAREYGVEDKVRFNHRAVRAEWSTPDARWKVQVERGEEETLYLTCNFLFMCSGYYHYTEPYTPEFKGSEKFGGQIVHPQQWPEDLDYDDKRVVVIGSGATAVTLVPAMAERAAHVTMLQRSPSYIVSLPAEDPVARLVRRILPMKAAYAVIRWKNVFMMLLVYRLSKRRPELVKKLIRKGLERRLPKEYDIDTHFTPTYNPWDQRMCLVPDSDLFEAISAGRASVVTDRIDTFSKKGILLESGNELEADLIITATGLNLLWLGGLEISVDDEDVDVSKAMSYKGLMLSGVPNMAFAVGYTNASWTLKCDLTSEYVCRLLNHMDAHGYRVCVPHRDPAVTEEPILDLMSGYVLRSLDKFPKQGSVPPWKLHQNYARDIVTLRRGQLEDGTIEFSRGGAEAGAEGRLDRVAA